MKRGLETYVYSIVGILAMIGILIAINVIGGRAKKRIDLTEERAYTLSQGTRNILAKIDTPIQVRFYCTRSENQMPVMLKAYAQRVEDLLGEYRQASKGQIEIQKLDPVPDSDAEDSARLDGIEGQMRLGGEPLYLGVSVSMLDQKEAVPFLSPERERHLEYDLSRAISRVITPEKPVVGVMSPLPVQGQQMNPMMARMGQRGQQPWVFLSELQRDFKVQPVEMSVEKIPDEVKLLVLIHPKGITDAAEYALDQFVLRGGKLIAFLDPLSVLDQSGQQMGMPMPSNSTVEKLLKAWGLTFDTGKVVADLDYVGQTRQGRAPAVLMLTEKAMDKDGILTVDNLYYVFGGAFTGTPVEGLSMTTIIKSSKNSQLVDPMMAQFTGEKMIQDFQKSGIEYPLAVRLTGKFKSAFPEGKPKPPEPPADPAQPAEKKDEKPAETGLKESAGENSVILVGDCDMIQDQIAVQEMQNPFGGGQRMVMPANGNLAFAQGAIDLLAGDSNLIDARSRASRERPFTVVKEMQTKAEQNFQSKIKELETGLAETQRRLNELQQTKQAEAGQPGQRFILSSEQQKEIENFRKKETDAKQQLKVERKKLRAGIDTLENRVKWLNIAAMPVLVTIAGVGLAMVRRSRRAAR